MAQDPAPCKPQRITVLHTSADRAMRPIVRVRVNGKAESFLINTAGIYSSVSPQTVADLRLVTRSAHNPIRFLSGEASLNRDAYVESMDIGGITVSDMWLAEMPQQEFVAEDQGMISGDILHNYDVELNPAAHEVSLYSHSNCGGENVSWTDQPYVVLPFEMDKTRDTKSFHTVQTGPQWHISVPAQLNGKNIRMVIDTGAAVSVMKYGDASYVLTESQMQNAREVSSSGAPQKVSAYNFETLRFGGVTVKGLDIAIVPGKRSAWAHLLNPKPQLILGADVLRKLHTYISYGEKKLYITGANAH